MLGLHTNKSGAKDFRTACERDMRAMSAAGITRQCLQIFAVGPRSRKVNLSDADKEYLRGDAHPPIVIHGAYIDNPWNLAVGSMINIEAEMAICADIGARGVIVHLGAGAWGNNLREIVRQLSATQLDVMVWLEIHAAKKSTFETPQKIRDLFNRITEARVASPVRFGLCVDTAHLHCDGIKMSTMTEAREWIDSYERECHDIPVMLHLNDCETELGSGKDKHALLGRGRIWGPQIGADSGLIAVLDWAVERDMMVVLERKVDSAPDLLLISRLGYFTN